MTFDIALIEKEGNNGLNINEINFLYTLMTGTNDPQVYPIELEAKEHECSAMGFISTNAAEKLDYCYETSGLHDFIASILDDMENEEKLCVDKNSKDRYYNYKGLIIWLNRM